MKQAVVILGWVRWVVVLEGVLAGMGLLAVKTMERVLERLVVGGGMGVLGFVGEDRMVLMLVMANRKSRGRNECITVVPEEDGGMEKSDACLSIHVL